MLSNQLGFVNPKRTINLLLARARSPSWHPLRRLRWKIIGPYALLTVLLGAIGTYMVTDLIAGSLRERFENQLAEAGRVAADAVVRKEREHLEGVRALAFTEGVAGAVTAGDTQSLGDLLEPVVTNLGLERAEVIDSSGNRLFGLTADAHNGDLTFRPIDGTTPSEWPPVQRALAPPEDERGNKFAGIVETAEGFAFLTAGPVRSGDQIVGVALVGTYLDSFARHARAEALAEVTFYDFSGRPLASSFAGAGSPSEEANLQISSSVMNSAVANYEETTRESRSVWKRDYDFAYGALIVRNQVVGLYSVALPTHFIFQAGVLTRWQMSAAFSVAMLLVLLTGYLLAQAITGRVRRLMGAAQKVASGDLSVTSSVSGEDEIGVLAQSFDEMTASLRARTRQLHEHHLNTIKTLTAAVDARDPYTAGHSVRVGELARLLGERLELPTTTLDALQIGGYLHDVGKIGIRDAILLKPKGLSDVERVIVDSHPLVGARILEPLNLPPEVLDFVLSHHERLDGSGYPEGVSSAGLSMVARIAAVCDVYDALTTDRPYRPGQEPENAIASLQARTDRLFDKNAVMALEAVYVGWETQRRTDLMLQGLSLPPTVADPDYKEAA